MCKELNNILVVIQLIHTINLKNIKYIQKMTPISRIIFC